MDRLALAIRCLRRDQLRAPAAPQVEALTARASSGGRESALRRLTVSDDSSFRTPSSSSPEAAPPGRCQRHE